MGSQTSLKTSQRGGCNPLNPPPGSATALRVLTGPLVVSSKGLLKTERGGSREFGNGIFQSALALPSL